ncbi:hypothetical protein IMZ48_23050, partial [Candidatus Bathyarchaeota archaeon]|nr:hypothetical protein [Candidatus Bathyarchaeota archaeon]
QHTHALLAQNGITPSTLTQQQLQQFAQQSPAVQAKSIATYSNHLQQQQSAQMPNRQMGNVPQGQGSPMMPQGPEGAAAIGAYYNPDMGGGPNAMRPVPGGGQPPGTGSNHALQDYQLQLMLLEQQNKKRLMMARQEQDNMGGMPRDGPNGPAPSQGPNGQMMPEGSPQAGRSGGSPNPAEQMKRGTPQMGNNMGSPHGEGAQSRGSPNAMNFMGGEMNPAMPPQFLNGGNMVANGQMNGMRPPSSHPNQQFNGPVNAQMMAARQQQGGANGQQPNGVQWQGGPGNNHMMQQGQGQGQQLQGTPQQRNSMPPPSGPAAAASSANNRTSSPQQPAQQGTPQPPTPSQATKPAPKKKESKSAKSKVGQSFPQETRGLQANMETSQAAAQKKNAAAATAAPPAEPALEAEAPTPATPMTPGSAAFKAGQPGGGANAAPAAVSGPNGPQTTAAPTNGPAAGPSATQSHPEPSPNFGMDNGGGMVRIISSWARRHRAHSLTRLQVDFSIMDFANPSTSEDVLTDFNFDAFLHEDTEAGNFDFTTSYGGMDATGGIEAE